MQQVHHVSLMQTPFGAGVESGEGAKSRQGKEEAVQQSEPKLQNSCTKKPQFGLTVTESLWSKQLG